MREIKFKGWDKEFGKMIQVSQLWLDQKAHKWGAGILDEHNDFHKMDTIELLEYTGLFDRYGKEIYEGYILKHSPISEMLMIEFHNGSFGYWYCKVFHEIGLNQIQEWEVIGNIYENSNLLNKAK